MKMKKHLTMLLCIILFINLLPTGALAEYAAPEKELQESLVMAEEDQAAPSENLQVEEIEPELTKETPAQDETSGLEPAAAEEAKTEEPEPGEESQPEALMEPEANPETESPAPQQDTDADTDAAENAESAVTILGDNGIEAEPKEESAILMTDAIVASGVCGSNVRWSLDQNGTMTVSGQGKMDDYFSNGRATYSQPWYSHKNDIKTLIVENGVTGIGKCAFMSHDNLMSVTLPEGITELPHECFCNCPMLTELNFPSSLRKLNNECLYGIGLHDFYIPASIVEVNGHFCGGGVNAIQVDPENPVFTSVDGVMFSKDLKILVMVPNQTGNEYVVPDGTEAIRGHAFAFNFLLKSVTIPKDVKAIGSCAFLNCSNLKEVTFLGGPPEADIANTFEGVTANTYYPTRMGWSEKYLINYGGQITWICVGDGQSFNDVSDPASYFYEPTYWAVDKGITSGTSETTFSPYNPCTRGQVMSFLYKASGSPEVSGENPFTDVKESDYFYKPVLWAVSQGITSGTSATTFSPYNTCTRAQVMAFLCKASGSPEVSGANPFMDVKESDYFYKPVLWAVANGITNGTSATTFSPYNTCTRGQVMTFLYKAMG